MTLPCPVSELLALIPRLAGHHVVVVGDLFLDESLIGQASRLSREAPVPVLELESRRRLPGGGANPAMNIVALGSRATSVGLIGDDEAGRALRTLLAQAGVGTDGLLTDPDRPTTTKTRLVAQGALRFPQQIARVDRVDRRPLAPTVEARVVERVRALGAEADAILVSDYRSGLVTPAVVQAVREVAAGSRLITADSQGRLGHFVGFHLVKCNRWEAESYLASLPSEGGQAGLPRPAPELRTSADFEAATAYLRRSLKVEAILITQGPEGMSLRDGRGYLHLPAANRTEVFDVTGAGDTVIAVATLALIAGATPSVAAALANYAAGLVVRRLGNATPSPEELDWAIRQWSENF